MAKTALKTGICTAAVDSGEKKRSPAVPGQLQILIASWMMAVTAEYLLLPNELRSLTGLSGIAQMSSIRVICITAAMVLLWNLLARLHFPRPVLRWLMVGTFVVYAVASLVSSFTWAFLAASVLVTGLFAVYGLFGWQSSEVPACTAKKERKGYRIAVGAAAFAFFTFVSVWTVARVRSFSSPTYDFGIFAQMFYSMKETGLPMTTVERDGMLSHFAVHVSPIYYLMLPAYCLVPRPETLQVLQAAVLASAVIPLWKLGKLHGLHPALRLLTCVLLLLYPSYAGGASYDLHENCFLPPLILFLLYGMDRKSTSITVLSALLTLMVKEDAAVYVAVIALYLLLRSCLHKDKWGILSGCALLAGAVAWFLGVTAYLAGHGDGVMNYRYQNFMYDGSDSLITVIKAVLLCPMKAVFECIDSEKLEFIGFTMLSLLGLPLLTRRYERYLLLIPYLLVNLMSDYRYQHDILFQYTFGPTACLFYLAMVNLADLRIPWHRFALTGIAACICLVCFCTTILPVAQKYVNKCIRYGESYASQRALLNTVPEDAAVAATTFYTTHLSSRSLLYDIRYCTVEHILDCEYVVIKVSDSGSFKKYEEDGEDGKGQFVKMLTEHGYVLESKLDEVMEIYRKG